MYVLKSSPQGGGCWGVEPSRRPLPGKTPYSNTHPVVLWAVGWWCGCMLHSGCVVGFFGPQSFRSERNCWAFREKPGAAHEGSTVGCPNHWQQLGHASQEVVAKAAALGMPGLNFHFDHVAGWKGNEFWPSCSFCVLRCSGAQFISCHLMVPLTSLTMRQLEIRAAGYGVMHCSVITMLL